MTRGARRPHVKLSDQQKRRGRVMLKPGVWVRQNRDTGENLCKVPRCPLPPASFEPFHRGLCSDHFVSYADGRPRCQRCKQRYSVDPMVEALCECCNGSSELTPFETHVAAQLARGASPVTAVQMAMGEGVTRKQAADRYYKLSKSERAVKRMKRAMVEAGITDEFLFGKLKKNIDATKPIFNGEGEMVAEVPDVRGSNQALDIAFKLQGRYPGKARPEPVKAPTMTMNVAVLPPEEQPRDDTPVFIIPADPKLISGSGDDE